MSSILITGASGFIGSHLAMRLFLEGHAVHILLKKTSDPWRLSGGDFSYHEVDLCDEKALLKIVKKINPNFIYHFAAYGGYPEHIDLDKIIQTNIIGTWNLLKATKEINYNFFINIGSFSEYGIKDYATKELHSLNPSNYYSFSKVSQTLLCQQYAITEKKPINTLRLYNVYGPREAPTRLIPALFNGILENKIVNLSAPEIVKDFVYVDDVIFACMRFLQLNNLSGEIFNIGTGKGTTIKKIVDIVSSMSSEPVKCNWNCVSRPWDSKVSISDCSKTNRMLGWRSNIGVSQGLKMYYEYFVNKNK
ncbi:MAG: NAD-dependent epimerase/dehydratase family protein [Candidatus Parcubacteria bacterium]|nr:NAD-dependent epimerase/dehydratase family protein [Candidatus Parcubacteria bacterium]